MTDVVILSIDDQWLRKKRYQTHLKRYIISIISDKYCSNIASPWLYELYNNNSFYLTGTRQHENLSNEDNVSLSSNENVSGPNDRANTENASGSKEKGASMKQTKDAETKLFLQQKSLSRVVPENAATEDGALSPVIENGVLSLTTENGESAVVHNDVLDEIESDEDKDFASLIRSGSEG